MLSLLPLLLAAQTAPAACAATPADLGAAASPDLAKGAPLTLGALAKVNLWPYDQITVAIPRGTQSASTYGGTLAFDVAEAGTYLFQADAQLTLDVAHGTGAFQPVGNPAPTCTGFAFAAAYKLDPGHYIVQLALSPSGSVRLLATR